MKLQKSVFLSHTCFVFTLLFFYHHGEAMDSGGWTQVLQSFHAASYQCNYIGPGTNWAVKAAAAQACEEVFTALDSLGLNTCHGWYKAKCRPIPDYVSYQCSVKIPACSLIEGMQRARTVIECAPSLLRPGPTERLPSRPSSPSSSRRSRRRGKEPVEGTSRRAGSGVTSPSQTGGSLLALDPPFPPSDSFPASPLNPQGPPVTAPPGFILDNNYSVDDVQGAGQSRSRSGSFPGSPYIPYPQLPPGYMVDPDFSVGDQDNALLPEYIVDPSFSVDDQDNANSQFDMYSGSGASYWGSEVAEYGGVSVADEAAADESQSVTPFQCLECKKYYKHLESLKGHLRLHEHNRRGKSFCERCNRKYSTPAYYRYHLRTVHNEGPQTLEQGYECDQCPAKFNTSKKLKDHRQIHEGATICPTCKKLFGTVSAKNKHMKKHSGAN